MKKIFSFLFVALFSVSLWAETKRIYCQMTYNWWYNDDCTIAAHFYNNDGNNGWPGAALTEVAGAAGLWYIDIDESTAYTHVIFARRTSSGGGGGAQTAAYELSTILTGDNNLLTITESSAKWKDSQGDCSSEWSEYTPKNVTLYFVKVPNWENVYGHSYTNQMTNGWPGTQLSADGTVVGYDIYPFTVHNSYEKVLFHDNDGHEITNLDYDESTPYYYNGTWYESAEAIDDEVNTKYFITGDANLVGSEKAWHSDAIRVKANSYTFENLAAGKLYKLAVSTDGSWGNDKIKKFRDLTEYAAGLYTDNDLNILFSMAEAGSVTVTYTNSEFKLEGNFALPTVTLKADRMPEPSIVMDPNTAAQTASATFTLSDEYIGEGKYYNFLISFSNLDKRCTNYTFNRDYDYTDNILSKGDSLSFRADFAGSYTITWNYATNGVTVVFAPIPDARYYVAGDLTDWNDTTQMARMVESEGVWSAGVTLNASSNYQFKIHRWQGPYQAIYGAHDAENSMTSSNCTDWKLSSPGENIKLTTSNAGQYTFKFTPTDNNDLDVVYPNATAIDNTEVSEKAVKRIENGQLVIIKNGVKYNALGAEVK